jgi:hypothetical protein
MHCILAAALRLRSPLADVPEAEKLTTEWQEKHQKAE